jgi:hypothetical protein
MANILERAKADGLACLVTRDKHGGVVGSHFLDVQAEMKFGRRQRHQIGVKGFDKPGDVRLQRGFDGDRNSHFATRQPSAP